jgi:hypothetical protein
MCFEVLEAAYCIHGAVIDLEQRGQTSEIKHPCDALRDVA